MKKDTNWTLLNQTKIEKDLDISAFQYRGSVIPQRFYSFFNAKEGQHRNTNDPTLFNLTLISNTKTFNNVKIKWYGGEKNPQRGIRIWWGPDLTEFLKNNFPKWNTLKANSKESSKMKLIFTKTNKKNEYKIELADNSRNYYWVNQGATWNVEREQSFLWAPILNKRKFKQYDWQLLKNMVPGDIVFSYTKQTKSIRAVSMVQDTFRNLDRPKNFGEKTIWMKKGRAVDVTYIDIEPIKVDKTLKNKICKYRKLFIDDRFIFNKNLHVREQYLFHLPHELGLYLLKLIPTDLSEEFPTIDGLPPITLPPKKPNKPDEDDPHGGQQYGIPKYNRIVEKYAMEFVEKEMIQKGYDVEDVSRKRNPSYGCDFIFTKGSKQIYAEVKGTRSKGEKVMITRNEYKKSKEYGSKSELYIVYNIILDLDKKPPKASGGKLKILKPWKPNSTNLNAITYDFDVTKH